MDAENKAEMNKGGSNNETHDEFPKIWKNFTIVFH